MPQSKCPKCGSSDFEGVNKKIQGLSFPITFVQCAKCGCVIGCVADEYLKYQVFDASDKLAKFVNDKLIELKTNATNDED